jgi:ubiquitin carboxyl-terminal hydrolase 10
LLLSAIHDECAHILHALPPTSSEPAEVKSPVSDRSSSVDGGWLEVGPKQKASVTRSSGNTSADAPTTKIFGGKLRSELRVPGLKPSITLEPYQPLQLAISSPDVNNIVDALKGLTKPETLHGEFKSPRGPGTTATKQLFIESLPPVLILHLKRFQYDNTGGAQKIWKKVGYPLDLIIPKEIFPPHKRNGIALSGLPKYRLTSVVYHHGKNANGGHYTVDVRRQDGREWIRLDDTVIRRVRSEDVAEGGAEEDPRVLAQALEQHKKDSTAPRNIFEQIEDEDNQSEKGEWNQVNVGAKETGTKKWSAVANGAHTPNTAGKRTPKYESLKDNKVAYILFYRRID